MTIMQIKIIITPTVNIGNLKARRLIIGCFMVIWRMTNRTSASTPIAIAIMTFGLPQPLSSPALLNPYTMPPNPKEDSTIDSASIFGLVTSETFCMNLIPQSRAITRNGSDSQKIQCQLRLEISSPAMVGPIAGATIITRPISPIAAPLFSGGMITRIVLNISGRSSAVPTACTTRASSRNSKLGALAAMKVPTMEKLTAAIKSCLVVNH
ncbi:hypothetical protein D3C73_1044900 [compost metagenome]